MTTSNTTTPSKQWSILKADSSWSIFKIMAEFVEGFETMREFGPCVSIFGSARTKPDNPYYQLTIEVAKKLVEEGYGVITGGGPGIMEAGNKGAQLANGKSVGLDIDLPFEASHNDYIDVDKILKHRYFFVRKVMFVKYAQGFIFMPGGFGTLDELFECLTLIQTEKSTPVPVVLMGTNFWSGIIDWLKNTVLDKHQNISPKDLDMFKITDDPDEAIKIIREFNGVLSPNF